MNPFNNKLKELEQRKSDLQKLKKDFEDAARTHWKEVQVKRALDCKDNVAYYKEEIKKVEDEIKAHLKTRNKKDDPNSNSGLFNY